ncbi:pgr5-like protein 1b chloroplastic [Phtheirospermum japonicum]|uniref:Pgr5-like protein 1b chloroplastic n=1 Tax=Phtheirospermum japonicum TaxID=374723 RepID=A0A830B8T4_9LAMI|nr:pgr5-like protein 1b chloroplastic [Phtheirospermum japonicum]
MAGTCSPVTPHVIGSSRTGARTGALFSVRISSRSHAAAAAAHDGRHLVEGPSCIFVGPVETANQETLEALYRQAREAYYGGEPLIVDDMFDRVELKLRWYGSKYVVKYPRCSLRRQSTYADAQEDPSQVFALASVWVLILGFGASACLVPIIYTITQAYQDAFNSGSSYTNQASALEFLATLNGMLFMLFGSMIGYPIASASGNEYDVFTNVRKPYFNMLGALRGLWKNDLVALKGHAQIVVRRCSHLLNLIGSVTPCIELNVMYVRAPWSSKQRLSIPSRDPVDDGYMVAST